MPDILLPLLACVASAASGVFFGLALASRPCRRCYLARMRRDKHASPSEN
jgi:hypothetical protein